MSIETRFGTFAEERGIDLFVGAITGFTATMPWIIAAWGWAQSWNAYINLTFTLGGFVLWYALYTMCRQGETKERNP